MIIQANAMQLPIASASVQCVVTSPPYWGLRDYGISGQLGLERTPEEYVANMVQVFREVWRVLKDDGTCWLNLGDSYAGSWGAQSRGSFTAGNLEGASGKEYCLSARQIMSHPKGTHTGSIKNTPGLKPKDLVGIPWRVAFALQADGWYLRSDIIWEKPNPMPESVTDRPTKSHEYLFLLAKAERYYYDAEAIKEPSATNDPRRPYTSEGAWQMDGRPIEQRHGGKVRSPAGWKTGNGSHGSIHAEGREREITYNIVDVSTRNKRSVWTIATQPWSGAHFATFPEKLVEPCILAGSRPGDLVFDPFVGSGTVIRVATRLQRRGVGCDLNFDYLHHQAKRRNSKVQVEMQYDPPNETRDSALSGCAEL